MVAFIIRRLLQALLVMILVGLIAFTLFRFVGDPVNQMVGIETSAQDREAMRQQLGLNDPVIVQFFHFVWNTLHFNFCASYLFKKPSVALIGDRFPAPMELTIVSALLSLLMGVPIGV